MLSSQVVLGIKGNHSLHDASNEENRELQAVTDACLVH